MIKKVYAVAALCFLLFILPVSGFTKEKNNQKIKWLEITKETKPWTRWWIFGSAMNKKDITAQLEEFKNAGLGGVEITPIYGMRGTEDKFINYLSPEFMEMLVYTLQEAKRLELG